MADEPWRKHPRSVTRRFLDWLEDFEQRPNTLEFLPDDEELSERFGKGFGLTRPEISVLISYAKMVLYDRLLESDLVVLDGGGGS